MRNRFLLFSLVFLVSAASSVIGLVAILDSVKDTIARVNHWNWVLPAVAIIAFTSASELMLIVLRSYPRLTLPKNQANSEALKKPMSQKEAFAENIG
jgi:hypothetical protein